MYIQDILGYQLATSSKLIKRTMDHYLLRYNITTSQWAVIKLLDTRTELTQSQIANELHSDKATAGEVIQRLTEKGYVKKELGKKDRRAYVICLTLTAKMLAEDIEKMAQDVTKTALKGLTEDDTKMLNKYLKQIIHNLTKEEAL